MFRNEDGISIISALIGMSIVMTSSLAMSSLSLQLHKASAGASASNDFDLKVQLLRATLKDKETCKSAGLVGTKIKPANAHFESDQELKTSIGETVFQNGEPTGLYKIDLSYKGNQMTPVKPCSSSDPSCVYLAEIEIKGQKKSGYGKNTKEAVIPVYIITTGSDSDTNERDIIGCADESTPANSEVLKLRAYLTWIDFAGSGEHCRWRLGVDGMPETNLFPGNGNTYLEDGNSNMDMPECYKHIKEKFESLDQTEIIQKIQEIYPDRHYVIVNWQGYEVAQNVLVIPDLTKGTPESGDYKGDYLDLLMVYGTTYK